LFEQCFNGQSQIGLLNDVTALLQANYANYAAITINTCKELRALGQMLGMHTAGVRPHDTANSGAALWLERL
jgi:hypothetical protein